MSGLFFLTPDCFMKVPRSPDRPGRGSYWTVNRQGHGNMFEDGRYLHRQKQFKADEKASLNDVPKPGLLSTFVSSMHQQKVQEGPESFSLVGTPSFLAPHPYSAMSAMGTSVQEGPESFSLVGAPSFLAPHPYSAMSTMGASVQEGPESFSLVGAPSFLAPHPYSAMSAMGVSVQEGPESFSLVGAPSFLAPHPYSAMSAMGAPVYTSMYPTYYY